MTRMSRNYAFVSLRNILLRNVIHLFLNITLHLYFNIILFYLILFGKIITKTYNMPKFSSIIRGTPVTPLRNPIRKPLH
jgi:hypothetical protein